MADAKVSDGTQLTNMPLTGKIYVDDSGVDKYVNFDDLTETGTFTPRIGDGTNNYTTTISDGYYTRVGKQVTVYLRLDWTSIGSAASTALYIDDLPYVSHNSATYRAAASFSYIAGVDNGGGNQILGHLNYNADRINFYYVNDNAAATAILADTSSATGNIQLTISYQVA